jgi:hypothetical protein
MSEPNLRERRSQDQIDTRALEIAMEARTVIERHERICDADRIERHRQMEAIKTAMEAVKDEVRKTVNKGMAYVIVLLIGSLGYFLIRYGLTGGGG